MNPFQSLVRSWLVFRSVFGKDVAGSAQEAREKVQLPRYQKPLFLAV
jgi:hypothetical protein